MTGQAFLDLFIATVDQLTPGDADYNDLRVERLLQLTEVADDFWHSHDFSWTYLTDAVTISGGDHNVQVPDGFHNLGMKGGVWRQSDGYLMTYRPPDVVRAAQFGVVGSVGQPEMYSFYEVTLGVEMFQTEIVSGSTTFEMLFKMELPTIEDSASDAGLDAIPTKYQRKVLIPGLRAMARFEVGDSRYGQFQEDPIYKSAKQRAIQADIKGKEQTYQMPAFFGG